MRKLSFVVVFLFMQLNVFAQRAELEVGYDLAQEMLQWEELNPTHKAESDRYLNRMNIAFDWNWPLAEAVDQILAHVDGAIPTMIEDSYDGRRKTWRATSVFVSLALYSEGEKRMFYLDLANHIARTDSDQTYAAVLLMEYIESIGSGAVEKRRSILLSYVQAYEEEIGIEFAERIYAFLGEK
jgi:hypothetical protein